jgi:radical SAM protein with 4Fe4S-binding SPASM domain
VPASLKYSWGDFVRFYKKALDYILQVNLNGKFFYERTASIFLTKILSDCDPNFLDIRSPCGAGIGQIAYNYNGDVYTCDEGRMLSRIGDESFRIGNVKVDNYSNIISHPTVKAMCIASCLDNLPGCSECVYKPYCGVCPLVNYAERGNIFIQPLNSKKCRIQTGILDYLFEKIKIDTYRKVFESWLKQAGVEKK